MAIEELSCLVLGQVPPLAAGAVLLPLYESAVAAGFPSPAEDYIEQSLDPTALLVKRPAATYFVRAVGGSMRDAGIWDGSILVVDRSIKPTSGAVVIAAIGGGLTVKRLVKGQHGNWILAAANPSHHDIPINPEEGVELWGVVTWSLISLGPR